MRFGRANVGPPEVRAVIAKYNATDEKGRYNNIYAQILLKEAYDIQTGLYDHNNPDLEHPLQGCLFTERKSVKKDSLFKRLMESYHVNQIHKYFGLTFLEFMDLPMDRIDELCQQTMVWAADEAKITSSLTEGMESELQKMKRNLNRDDNSNGSL